MTMSSRHLLDARTKRAANGACIQKVERASTVTYTAMQMLKKRLWRLVGRSAIHWFLWYWKRCLLRAIALHGPLARYVKLRVAHVPGMPGTSSPPPRVSDPDKDHGTCVTHVPWCMPVSLTSGSFEVGGEENVPDIPGACASRNFTYLVRGPLRPMWLHYRGPQNADSVPAIIMIISRWTATRVTIITLNATLCTDGNIVITRSAAVVFAAITLDITLCIVRRRCYHLGHCPSLHCHYLEYHNTVRQYHYHPERCHSLHCHYLEYHVV